MGKGEVSWRATRVESLALLALVMGLYAQREASWVLLAVLILAPDLSATGYLVNPRIGALGYNLCHTLLGPIVLGALGLLTAIPFLVTLSLIWAAHITFDRAIGYGLKDVNVPTTSIPEAGSRSSGNPDTTYDLAQAINDRSRSAHALQPRSAPASQETPASSALSRAMTRTHG